MALSVAETPIEQGQKAKITLHWLEKSRSHRTLWLLEECNAPYELQTYKRGKDMLAPASLKAVHPLGKSPVISVESPATEKPLVLPESAFITEYALDYFGKQYVPKRWKDGMNGKIGGETEEWMRYRHWMHYAEGSLMTILMIAFVVQNIKNPPGVPFFIKPIPRAVAAGIEKQFLKKQLELHFNYLEAELKKTDDFMMIFPLQMATAALTPEYGSFPMIEKYVKKMESRDAYQRAVKKIVEVHGEFNMKL